MAEPSSQEKSLSEREKAYKDEGIQQIKDEMTTAMQSKPHSRGLAIVLGVFDPRLKMWRERSHSHHDTYSKLHYSMRLLTRTFKHLDFAIFEEFYSVISAKELETMTHVATHLIDYPKSSNFTIVVAVTALVENDVNLVMDEFNISRDIIEPFLPPSAPALANIPKLFFINTFSEEGHRDTPKLNVPSEGNFLVSHISMKWYDESLLQYLVWKVFDSLETELQSRIDPIEKVLERVASHLHHTKTSMTVISHLDKPVYLHPDSPKSPPDSSKSYSEEHTSNLDKYQAGSTRIATIAPDSQLKIAGDQSHVQSHDQAVESHDQGEDSSDKIHSIKLSELAYGDFVTRFGDLFVDGFAVKDDIANAVLSYKSDDIQIVGVSLGMKKVSIGRSEKSEVRPALVVLFDFLPQNDGKESKHGNTDMDEQLPPQADQNKLIKLVIDVVNARNPADPQKERKKDDPQKERKKDDPHWLNFEFSPPDMFANADEDEETASEQFPPQADQNKLVKLVIDVVNARNPADQECQYVFEDDPHWLNFEFSPPDMFADLASFLGDNPNHSDTKKRNGVCNPGPLPRQEGINFKKAKTETLPITPDSEVDSVVPKPNVSENNFRPGDEFDCVTETNPTILPEEREDGGTIGLFIRFNVKNHAEGKEKHLHYGVTCLHCGIPEGGSNGTYDKIKAVLDKSDIIGEPESRDEYIGVCHSQSLIPHVVEPYLSEISVYPHLGDTKHGSYKCGLYSYPHPAKHDRRIVQIEQPPVQGKLDAFINDFALFSVDHQPENCLPQTIGGCSQWEILEAEGSKDLFKKYRVNERRLCIWKAKEHRVVFAQIQSLAILEKEEHSSRIAGICLKGGSDFADPGDCGSLLFLENAERVSDSVHVNVVVGILSRGKNDKSPRKNKNVYYYGGFFLQPALDICVFQLYLQEVYKLQESLTNVGLKTDFDELCTDMAEGPITLEQKYQYGNLLECSYSPCLNECGGSN